mgnify:CR=1 FL=1
MLEDCEVAEDAVAIVEVVDPKSEPGSASAKPLLQRRLSAETSASSTTAKSTVMPAPSSGASWPV